ncbi:MAG: pyrroline-5-carboxylate reductase [Bdellovibrionota bacterium]
MKKKPRVSSEKIGIIGLGKMGQALALGLRQDAASGVSLQATCRSAANAAKLAGDLGIPVHLDSKKLARESDIVLVCVKPFQAKAVISAVARELTGSKILVSICAGVTVAQLAQYTGGKCLVVRAMPNTPALIGQGMTVFAPGPRVSESDVLRVTRIFERVGRVASVEDALMNGVTGLSGCGPAYAFLMIEALSDAGVKVGIKRELSTLLAAQTLMGAAALVLSRGIHPAELKDQVSTPAGCTIDGLMALEEGKLRVTLIKAVLAAAARSAELS